VEQGTKFGSEDVDTRCGLHIVFATASPVLTNEVKRYYERLNQHLKEELERKEKIAEERKRKEELEGSVEVIHDEDDDINLDIEMEENEDQWSEEEEDEI